MTRSLRGPTRDAVVEDLEGAILGGQHGPGDMLPSERQLARTYHVSRPVVREALRALATRRLIEIAPGRGAFVLRPNAADGAAPLELLLRRQGATVRDLTEARLMLECEAAALAAQRADLEDIVLLERALLALDAARSGIDHIRRDLAFHLCIAGATHNPVIEAMLLAITRFSVELMVRSVGNEQAQRVSDRYHRAAYEAINARDPDAARRAIAQHLGIAAEAYGPEYEEALDSVALRGLLALGFTDIDSFFRTVIGGDGQVDVARLLTASG